ncbi:hypothetical protein ACWEVD_29840 [Nocardia thailandica]|uniref:Uncharacterized protein n=1 Tax=Nocardia thailandica TaxID=257275 RepID=A0ABW6PHM8_9NOCA|nr:hypothetical protein [Nocardia thailandica]
MTWTTIARSLTAVAAGCAAGFTLFTAPAHATNANPLDCSGVPGAQAAADRESAARGIAITPLCFDGGLYSGIHAGIPLAVMNPLTLPGTVSVCVAERETVEAAARYEWTKQVHVMPMCIQNRAFGVYEL